MAEVLPITFPVPAENAIASYDYKDIVDGSGIVDFVGYSTATNGGTTLNLGTNSLYSNDIELDVTNLTKNFDTNVFNSPRTVKGTAIISFSVYGSANAGFDTYFIITAQKIAVGGGTTDIGSVRTATFTKVGAGTDMRHITTKLSLTQTNFKIGESLRFSFANTFTGGIPVCYIGIDPVSRVGTYLTDVTKAPTKMDILVPFRINL